MSTSTPTIDLTSTLAPVRECIEGWNEGSQRIEADFNALLGELEAYRGSLQAWQAALSEERNTAGNLAGEAERHRQRVEELEASLAAERAELAEQQSRWDEDFHHLRALLDDQEAPPGPSSPPSAEAAATAADSVLEQFGQLRKQQADRRTAATTEE